MLRNTGVYDKRNTLQSAFTYIPLPMIALKRKYVYYSRVLLNILGLLHVALYFLIAKTGISEDLFHAIRIRTSANYRLARKSSSRGPNAAFARVTEIRKNFYTL